VAILLGIVEGATEFLPISSTGHLILVQSWLSLSGARANAFIIFIQLGAVLAVLWLYRAKFIHISRDMFHKPQARGFVVNLVVGTLPAVIIGLPTQDWIEIHLFKPLPVILALIAGGLIILWIEKRQHQEPCILTVDQIPLRTALGIGCVQVLSLLFPGLSRSGATIIGGMGFGLSRVAATEFSFFLAIPVLLGAALIKLMGVWEILSLADLPVFATGFLVSFIVALIVIQRLLALVSQKSFVPFAWYRIIFGALMLSIYYGNLTGF